LKAILKIQNVAVLLTLVIGCSLQVNAGLETNARSVADFVMAVVEEVPGVADSSVAGTLIDLNDSILSAGQYPGIIFNGDFESWYEFMEYGGAIMPGSLKIPILLPADLDFYRSGEFIKVSENFRIVLGLLLTLPGDEQIINVYPHDRKVRLMTMQEHEPILELDEYGECQVTPIYLMCWYDLSIEEFRTILTAVIFDPVNNTARYLYDFEKQIYIRADGKILPITPDQLFKIAIAFADIDLKKLYVQVILDSLEYKWNSNAKE